MINCELIGLLSGDGWDKAKDASRRVYSAEAVSPTITTCGGGRREVKIADCINNKDFNGKQPSLHNRIYDSDGIAVACTTAPFFMPNYKAEEPRYRIRKLTPRECWRLMDFDDEDFDRAAAVNSKTQLYKQAGNSIVVNCLVAIFGQMIEGKENVYKERKEPKP